MGNDLLPAADTPRMPPAWLLWKPSLVISSRSGCRAAPLRQNRRQFPRLSPVDAHQRMGDVGIQAVKDRLASPAGTPLATTVTFAPMESPFFSARASVHLTRRFYPGPGRERILFNLRPVFDFQRNVSHLVRQPRISIPNFSARYFLAIALLQRAWRFRGRKNVHRRDNAQTVFLFVGVISMAWTEDVLIAL